MNDSNKQFPLDYSKIIVLDAESLAEGGFKKAYDELISQLKEYIQNPSKIHEESNPQTGEYSVYFKDEKYNIAENFNDQESWGKATFAFFDIVNKQLEGIEKKFYAINGGNDLGGMFLTTDEVEEAKRHYERKNDWPYIPASEGPWYGQPHEENPKQ